MQLWAKISVSGQRVELWVAEDRRVDAGVGSPCYRWALCPAEDGTLTHCLMVSLPLQTHSGYFSSLYPHHQFGPFPHHHPVSAPPCSPALWLAPHKLWLLGFQIALDAVWLRA